MMLDITIFQNCPVLIFGAKKILHRIKLKSLNFYAKIRVQGVQTSSKIFKKKSRNFVYILAKQCRSPFNLTNFFFGKKVWNSNFAGFWVAYLFSQFFMKYVLFYEKACNLVRWLKIFQLVLLEDIITPFSYSSLFCATGHYCPLVKYRLIIDSWPKDTRHTAQRPDATRTKQLISDHNSYTKWTFSYKTPFKYE